jgi:hypothetical protein
MSILLTANFHLALRMRKALAEASPSRKKRLAQRWKKFRRAESKFLRNTRDEKAEDAYRLQKQMLTVWLDATSHLPDPGPDPLPVRRILKKWRH